MWIQISISLYVRFNKFFVSLYTFTFIFFSQWPLENIIVLFYYFKVNVEFYGHDFQMYLWKSSSHLEKSLSLFIYSSLKLKYNKNRAEQQWKEISISGSHWSRIEQKQKAPCWYFVRLDWTALFLFDFVIIVSSLRYISLLFVWPS